MRLGGCLTIRGRRFAIVIEAGSLSYSRRAAPEFIEMAAAELLEEEWKKRSMAKLPQPTTLDEAMSARLG